GLRGMRDEGGFDAALGRPRHIQTYEENADLARLASAYCYGLIRNHPFNDGNKRAGFLALGLFLSLNGFELDAPQADAAAVIMAVAAGDLSERRLTEWVREHIVRSH